MHLVPQSSFIPRTPEPKTLVEGAYLALRRDIINGVHPPSTKLRVEHLKDRYNVGAPCAKLLPYWWLIAWCSRKVRRASLSALCHWLTFWTSLRDESCWRMKLYLNR